jgi:hypothetical protein
MKRYTTQQETVKAGEEKTKDLFDKLGDATVKAEKGIKAYNTAANIINAFNGERVMPKIDTNIQNANKDAVIKRRKDLKAEAVGKKEMPSWDEVKKNMDKYDNDTLNAWAKKKTDTDSAQKAIKEAFEGKDKTPTKEDILKDPSKYSDAQVKARTNLEKDLSYLRGDNKGGKGKDTSDSDIEDAIERILRQQGVIN